MKMRSRTGGGPIKGRRRKTPEPKRRSAQDVQARSKVPPATKETEVIRLIRELSEERKQRAATSEVLHLLSGSHGDLNRVFDSILSNATKLCQANFGTLSLYEGDAFRVVAMHNAPPAYGEHRHREPLVRGRPLLRMAETKQLVHIADLREYVASNPADEDAATFAKLSGVRTVLIVAMLKDGEAMGAIVIYRQEVRPFNDREIELLKSFAAQAVIAIENARLLNELRQRTSELTESLERQTATSDVLQVVSSSLGDLKPVFEAMLQNATRICAGRFGILWLYEGGDFRCAALHNAPAAFGEQFQRQPVIHPAPGAGLRSLAETRQVTHVADMAATQAYIEQRAPAVVAAVELGGVRTFVHVPMLEENNLIGAITVYRQEVRPFGEKQIELLKNFAAQAVIAIENARLLNELRQSLEQQTATSAVLEVISSSLGELNPVFRAILGNATRICEAKFGNLDHYADGAFRLVASNSSSAEVASELLGGALI